MQLICMVDIVMGIVIVSAIGGIAVADGAMLWELRQYYKAKKAYESAENKGTAYAGKLSP